MAQLTKIRMPDGRVLVPGDWTSAEPLYSTVEMATGAITTLAAFSYGIGNDVPGSVGPRKSNIRDTNLEGEGSRLPENEELVVYNLMIELFGVGSSAAPGTHPYGTDTTNTETPDAPMVSLLDVLRVQRDVLIVTNIAAIKEYTRQPLGYFPATTSAEQVNSGANSVNGLVTGWLAGSNGNIDAGSQRTFASPLYIAGGESFNVEFRFPRGQIKDLNLAANGRIRACVYLDGYRKRPVA